MEKKGKRKKWKKKKVNKWGQREVKGCEKRGGKREWKKRGGKGVKDYEKR